MMMLGAVLVAGVVIGSLVLATNKDLPSRKAVALPLTLDLSNAAKIGDFEPYPALTDVVVDLQYGQNLTVTSDPTNWKGQYAIVVTVSATELTEDHHQYIIMNYTGPDTVVSTPLVWSGSGTTWSETLTTTVTDGTLGYSALYKFSIYIDHAFSNIAIDFAAVLVP